ncbi:MAG: energy-coupling factor transporter ATPase [Clostridia bacterium]|jgi:energy-coupling factor transport system ATP-binding protein|nr:energy-coupling factor transporter ATPase [Clostridia bacterium]
MPCIEIKNLNFTYSKKTPYEKRALKDINLTVDEGEFIGLVGATGSGKSTLIQHLNGLIKVQDKKQSSVAVNGMSATDKKTLKKLRFEVGLVFQYPEYQLFGDTVAKDVAFGPKNMKLEVDEVDRRVRRALEVVGLEYDKFAERSPFDLSGGEKRRVAIAGVIAMQPRVLVLDEPVAGLDPVGRSEILALIKKLQKEISPTVITVSHNMDDMAAMADRIIALKDGEIVADGSPKRVFCNRRLIAEAGLDLPAATRITDTLKARGIDLPSDIVTMDELARELEKLRKRGLLKAERSAESDYFGKAEQDDLSELSGEDDDV